MCSNWRCIQIEMLAQSIDSCWRSPRTRLLQQPPLGSDNLTMWLQCSRISIWMNRHLACASSFNVCDQLVGMADLVAHCADQRSWSLKSTFGWLAGAKVDLWIIYSITKGFFGWATKLIWVNHVLASQLLLNATLKELMPSTLILYLGNWIF